MAAVWPCFAFVMVLLSYFITPSSVQHSGNHYHNVSIPTPFDKSNEFISFADISIHFWGLWVHGHFTLCQNVLEHEILYMVNVMGNGWIVYGLVKSYNTWFENAHKTNPYVISLYDDTNFQKVCSSTPQNIR